MVWWKMIKSDYVLEFRSDRDRYKYALDIVERLVCSNPLEFDVCTGIEQAVTLVKIFGELCKFQIWKRKCSDLADELLISLDKYQSAPDIPESELIKAISKRIGRHRVWDL